MAPADRFPVVGLGSLSIWVLSHPNVLEPVSGEINRSQYPLVWVLELTPKEAAKIT